MRGLGCRFSRVNDTERAPQETNRKDKMKRQSGTGLMEGFRLVLQDTNIRVGKTQQLLLAWEIEESLPVERGCRRNEEEIGVRTSELRNKT